MSRRAKIFNFMIILLSVIILLCYLLFVDGLENIWKVFSSIHLVWLMCGAFCMVCYWTIEGIILNAALGFFSEKMSKKHAAKTCMIGQFFNCITPSATGGQPMQAYYMYRVGVRVGSATSALLIRFLIYQLVLTIYSLVVLIFEYGYFASHVQEFKYIILFGFSINTVIATMLLLIGFCRPLAQKIANGCVKFLAFLHIVKKPEEKLVYVAQEVAMFHEGFATVKTHRLEVLKLSLLTVFQLTFFFAIPVCIALSFHISLSITDALEMIAGAAFVQISSSFIPLPGAAGGAELSFYLVFGMAFKQTQLGSAILLWRLLTFYMPILVGLVFSRDLFGQKIEVQESLSSDQQINREDEIGL